MDVRLSAEQRALRDSAAQIAARLGPRTVAELDAPERSDASGSTRTAKLAAAVAASGFCELRVPERGDTPLASGVEVAIVAEEFGRGLVDAPFLGPTLAAELRRLAGAPVATAAETVLLVASLSGPAVTVHGSAPAGAVAIDAEGAATALALVPTATDHRLASVALVPVVPPTDLTRPTALPDAAAAVALVEGAGIELSAEDLDRWTAFGLAVTCADLVGTMRGLVDLTVEYATARRQYGRPIGSFQAIQHLLADAFVLMEGSRSAATHAAWAVDALSATDALGAAAAAKAYCARAARTVGETAIQVHGGIGNTWDCLVHAHLRRALLSSDVLGGTGVNLERVLTHRGIGAPHGLQ